MDDDNHAGVLNLDEVLGRKTLKVRYQGKEYKIRAVDALSPEDFGRVMAYGEKLSSLSEADLQHNNGQTIIKAIDDVLEIIGPDLPRYQPTARERINAMLGKRYQRKFALSLQDCVAVLQFWTENNRKNAAGAVVKTPRKRTRKS